MAVSGTLTFAPQQVTGTILVPIYGDVDVEPNETFLILLSGCLFVVVAIPHYRRNKTAGGCAAVIHCGS